MGFGSGRMAGGVGDLSGPQPLTAEEIEEAKALCDRVSDVPSVNDPQFPFRMWLSWYAPAGDAIISGGGGVVVARVMAHKWTEAVGNFVANCRSLLPRAIATIDARDREIAALRLALREALGDGSPNGCGCRTCMHARSVLSDPAPAVARIEAEARLGRAEMELARAAEDSNTAVGAAPYGHALRERDAAFGALRALDSTPDA